MSERFLTLTFEGGRFAAHSAPVEVLAELATLQMVVLKIARHLYLKAHSERQRVPRGFPEAAQLFLVAADANCFTAVLERPGTWPGARPEDLEVFERARELTLEALDAPHRGYPLPPLFPSAANESLAALGKSLEGEEHILVKSATRFDVRVDRESRSRLAELIHRPLETLENIDGEVEQVDDAGRSCVLRSRGGRRILLASFDVAHREDLLEALRMRPIVRVRLRGQVTPGSLPKVKTVDYLELVDDERASEVLKVWDRLKSFDQIPSGWIAGEGRPPAERAVQVAKGVLGRLLVEHQLPRPSLFPAPGGAVQAEWILGRWAVDVVFDSDDEGIQAEATHADTGVEKNVAFDRTQVHADSVSALGTWLEIPPSDPV